MTTLTGYQVGGNNTPGTWGSACDDLAKAVLEIFKTFNLGFDVPLSLRRASRRTSVGKTP